jgi:streptogrisin C
LCNWEDGEMRILRNILPAMITGLVTFGMASAVVAQQEPLLPASDNDTPLELSEVQESVNYLMSTYAVSQEEALRRLEAQRFAPALAEALAGQLPDEYAGMWLDQEGGGVLVVGTTRPDRLADLQSRVPQHVRLRLAQATWSLRELTKTADRVKARMGSDTLAKSTVVVDEQRNLVVSYTRDEPDVRTLIHRSATLRDAVMAEEGRVVTEPLELGTTKQSVIQAPPPPESCAPEDFELCAPPPMRGGMRLNIYRDDGSIGGCTNGFNVEGVGQNNNGLYYTLVAGHCVMGPNKDSIQTSNHSDIPVGHEAPNAEQNYYPVDFAIMPYGVKDFPRWADSRDLSNFWLSGGGRNLVLSVPCPRSGCRSPRDIAIRGVQDYNRIMKKAVVCAIGSASADSLPKEEATDANVIAMRKWLRATRCGEVTKLDGGIVTNICARPGDSGGPLYGQTDHLAYGILDNGTTMDDLRKAKPPRDPATCHPDLERNSYSPVYTILETANHPPFPKGYLYRIIDHP